MDQRGIPGVLDFARMRVRLKYILPPLQMLLAITLVAFTWHWERVLARFQDMPGTPPSFTLLMAINAPLLIPRLLLSDYLRGWWDPITLVAAIGMFWYWVSLNIGSWQRSHRLCTFSWRPLRLAVDAIAVGIGIMLAFVLSQARGNSLTSKDWRWSVPCLSLLVVWSAALILLFGRDLAQCLLPIKANVDGRDS